MRKKQYRRRRTVFTPQRIILTVIIICFAIVICFSVFSLTYNPEDHVKGTIENLSRDYYENYLYPNISKTDNFKDNPANVMEKYEKHGFSAVSLRQLLLYDNHKNEKYDGELTKYCDKDRTVIKFYPESPYEKTNYRVDYTYSCEF